MKIIDIFEDAERKTVTLYRGDTASVEVFSKDYVDNEALFGPGLYLTNNPRVAKDYTVKGDDSVLFDGARDIDVNTKDKRAILRAWIDEIADALDVDENEVEAKKDELRSALWKEEGDLEAAHNAEMAALRAQDVDWRELANKKEKFDEVIKKLRDQYQKKYIQFRENHFLKLKKMAIDEIKKSKRDIRFIKNTQGEYSIIEYRKERSVSVFNIPFDVVEKTVPAEEPMSSELISTISGIIESHLGKDRKLDFRLSDDWEFRSFDKWVEDFKKFQGNYAWSDDRVIGGKGVYPSFDEFANGTFSGITITKSDYFYPELIKKLESLGYTGFKYRGGDRTSGIPHTAYVFWDFDLLNNARVSEKKPRFNRIKPNDIEAV